jgi:hypothetical protein
MGRPTLLDDNVATALIALLQRGNYRKVAAEFVGIRAETIDAWVSKGAGQLLRLENDEELTPEELLFADFAAGVMRAEAEGEIRALEHVTNAGIHDWRAAAWYLERTKPDRFGRIDRGELTANLHVTVDPGELSRKLQHLMTKALNQDPDGLVIDAEVVTGPETAAALEADWDDPLTDGE